MRVLCTDFHDTAWKNMGKCPHGDDPYHLFSPYYNIFTFTSTVECEAQLTENNTAHIEEILP